ncbi:alpha/beta hydrolase-fold protein [Gaetbulibacter sp. M235]|uniref:alpha/beta hydrolase n=1 Tax=Gaetbulibacter sp. M235 TaxID=3126510 RepID=UPI00374FB929
MKTFLFIICFSISQILFCQVTFIINNLPENHDYKKDIYISGDFEGWSGGEDQYKLIKNHQEYHITIPKLKEAISFKFTLGSWDSVECGPENSNIENRTYSFTQPQDTVVITISNWTDKSLTTKHATASKNVHVFTENFKMPQLNRERKIWVYLPPNYETSSKRFPVLYMHDGQNVFDNATSYAGEWEVDETLNRLSKDYGLNLIVVAIDNGVERLSEYSPWENSKYGKAEGDAYLDFIVSTLKPEIDKTYRTKNNAKNTAIMGSSMGGLISHYAGLKYPNVFGKIGVFSPSFWYASESFNYTEEHANQKHLKMYFLVGANEGGDEQMANDMQAMVKLMKTNGFKKKNVYSKVVPDGIHSESFWKVEFEAAVRWLFLKN